MGFNSAFKGLMFIWGIYFWLVGLNVYFEDIFLKLAVVMAYFDVNFLRFAVLMHIMLLDGTIHVYDLYSGVTISKLGRHTTYLDR